MSADGRRPGTGSPTDPRTTTILAASFLGLLLILLGAQALPAGIAWGLDYPRDLGPAWRFGPWLAVLALTLLAAVPGRRAAAARRLAWLHDRPVESAILAALACGALCLAFPDLTLFTGDAVLRRSAVSGVADFDRLFPQAMPLDRLLHLVVPRALMSWTGASPETLASGLGVVEAAAFGALAVAFALGCGLRGLAALAATTTVAGGAALGLFTGYDKAFAEMCVVTLGFAVAGLGELGRGRPGWASGLLVAVALGLHRSGLALLPAWIMLWALTPAPSAPAGPRRWPWARLVPAAAIAAFVPLAWRHIRAVDAQHLAPTGAAGALAAAVAPERLRGLANLAFFLVPLVLLLPAALWSTRPAKERCVRWLGVLALSWLVPMLLVHPVQGEFRDWDVFAAGGVALALPLALRLGRSLGSVPAPLALAIAATALVPRLQWLALQTDPPRALARIEAWAAAPHPPRSTAVASALEFVAIAQYQAGRIAEGRRAMAAAIAQAPWERLYLEWAKAESQVGDWAMALELFDRAARMAPRDPTPWYLLGLEALDHRDGVAGARAVAGMRRLSPGDPRAEQLMARLRAMVEGGRAH